MAKRRETYDKALFTRTTKRTAEAIELRAKLRRITISSYIRCLLEDVVDGRIKI